MKEENRIEFLRKTELFSSLSREELQQIMKDMVIKDFKKNQTILYEEDSNDFMYVILDGEVKAVQRTEEGKEIILALHRKGESFGEMCLFGESITPAAVVAKRNSVVALISKRAFFSSLLNQEKMLMRLLRLMCSRLRECWKTVQILSFNNASQRIKMLLIVLSGKYGERSDGEVWVNVRFTHQEIAEMTGMTRETVTRVMDELQKAGELRIRKDRSIVLNPEFYRDIRYVV
ncbi:MAG: Crp/Fnr family transcriptional regulator [Alphaproteobacteria bacterium]|uniref:Crp/Fnr family transcriptional regulator n=1 Tax=Candidatus Nitrobium versatile TaxID=2884831 RepID=A0A953M2L8_9BACT|nr:Crp/Fnr family transcriptional regulator [Candidatus Nitrobium versatile]